MTERTVSIRLQINDQEYAQKLKRVERATTGAFDEGTKKAAKQRQAMSDVSSSLGVVGAAAVGAAGVSVGAFARFDKAMSSVKATGDDARGSFDELRKAAVQAGKETAFSATEAAAGVENLLKAGVEATDVLGGGLTGALDLAAAGQIGVAEAAETAATAMTQFKLSGKDVPHIADLLAAGAGKAQGEVSDMAQALKQSGLVASQFGLSIEDTTGTLAAFASAGLIGSDAGTSFKTMLLALANPADKTKGAMEDLGIAAYDAQGNFVGITNLAQQLKDKLGPLDQATRDAALAQIFGNDAIRAANVLFQQGASGIRGWIDNVDDAGYAAETAATKMDNLSGDLEAFMGSVETALIGAGEGANGPLRDLVQGATDAVNAFSELPPETQQATLAIVGGGGLVALGVAGMSKLVVGISETKGALQDLGLTGKRAAGALKFAGVVGAVVALGTVASEVGEHFGGLNEDIQDVANSLEGFAEKGQLTGAAVKLVGDDFGELEKAIGRLGNPEGAEGFTNWADKYLFPFRGSMDLARISVEKMDESLTNLASSGGAEDAAAAFAQITQRAQEQGVPVEKLRELFPQYTAVIRSTKDGQDALAESTAGLSATEQEATTWTSAYGETSSSTAKDLREMQEAADALYQSLNLLNGTNISAEEAALAFREQVRGMKGEVEALKEEYGKNATSLAANTAAGDANRAMLLDGIQAAETAAQKTYENTLKTKGQDAALQSASATMGQHIKTLRDEAIRLGLNGTEVDKYIAKQLGIPVKQVTNYTAPGLTDAIRNSKDLADTIDRIEDKAVTFRMKLDSTGIPVEVIEYKGRSTSGKNRRREADGYHDGGLIHGPGSGTSDEVPIWASNGEFVSTAESTRRNEAALEAGNQGAQLYAARGYRDGGIVHDDAIALTHQTPGMGTALDRTAGAAGMYEGLQGQVAAQLKDWFTEAAEAVMGTPGGPFPGGSSAVGTWRGKHYTHAMIARLMKAEKLAGTTMYVSQGGFRPTTSYSGTTHNKDAVDVGSPTTVAMQNALRAAGIAAWIRTPAQGPWSRHIHGVPMPGGGVQLSASAYGQTQAYLRGGDGLRGLKDGGWINEPVSGVGLRSGTRYAFAEDGPEYVIPEHKLTGGGGVDINVLADRVVAAIAQARPINVSTAHADPSRLATEIGRTLAFAG